MKIQFMSAILFILAISACEKSKTENSLYIRGRLFLTDTVTGNIKEQPLANAKVTLTDNLADTINYKYSANTNSDGYFVFNLLQEQYPYRIQYNAVSTGYTYHVSRQVNEGDNNISLVAILDLNKQNGFLAYAVDSTPQAGTIPAATALVYTSEVLANTNDPAGAVYTLTADASGKLFKLNIPPGRYYVNVKKQSGALTLQRLKKIINVPVKGIAGYPGRDTVLMRQ